MTFLYKGSMRFFFISPRSLLIVFIFSSSQTSLSYSKPPTQMFFGLSVHFLLLVCLFFTHSSCISHFWPNFWVFFVENLGFYKIVGFFHNIFGLVFVKMFLNHHALHLICIITIFHAFRCVFTLLQWLYAGRFGLDWAHDVFKFACHMFMHFSYIRTFNSLHYYILSCWCFSNCLFLSLSLFLALVCFQTQIYSIPEPFSFWGIHFFF